MQEFLTTQNGFRLATSVRGVLTGRGADFIIIDDPLKPEEALSESQWVRHGRAPMPESTCCVARIASFVRWLMFATSTDRKDTETDRDLVSLHTDPRWQTVLNAMSDLKQEQDRRWGDSAFATPNAPNISDEEKIAGLSELWAQAKFGFANFWHVPQLNWDQTYRYFIPKVLATKSTKDYYRVLQRFYALLQDGHSNVYSPDEVEGKVGRLDLRTRLIDGHLLVIGFRSPAADRQGLRPGDEILTINGVPAIAWAEQNVEPFVSSSSQQDRETRTFEHVPFLAPLGTSFILGTEDPAGRRETHTFVVARSGRTQKPSFEFRMLADDVAYVALNSFEDNTAANEWDKHWPEIQKAKSLILDLRENGGGSDSVGYHILGSLITMDSPGELSRSTKWIATYRAWGASETPLRFPIAVIHPDPTRHFAGPVALLISSRTFSAGEDMVVAFAQAHRGSLVGEATGGSSGQLLTFKLPGGGTAAFAPSMTASRTVGNSWGSASNQTCQFKLPGVTSWRVETEYLRVPCSGCTRHSVPVPVSDSAWGECLEA